MGVRAIDRELRALPAIGRRRSLHSLPRLSSEWVVLVTKDSAKTKVKFNMINMRHCTSVRGRVEARALGYVCDGAGQVEGVQSSASCVDTINKKVVEDVVAVVTFIAPAFVFFDSTSSRPRSMPVPHCLNTVSNVRRIALFVVLPRARAGAGGDVYRAHERGFDEQTTIHRRANRTFIYYCQDKSVG